MKNYLVVLMVIVFVSFSLPAVTGQELPKATKYNDVTWYSVTYYKFQPGKASDALKLIYDYLVPAGKAAGYQVIHFDVSVGDWDHIAFFRMDGGPGDLGWETAPIYEKFVKILSDKFGPEKLRELDNFDSMIARSRSEVVMRRKVDE